MQMPRTPDAEIPHAPTTQYTPAIRLVSPDSCGRKMNPSNSFLPKDASCNCSNGDARCANFGRTDASCQPVIIWICSAQAGLGFQSRGGRGIPLSSKQPV